ncbi:MAG: site-specific DNA-methyltransferase [Oscillospiraceae bacterium]
MPILDWIGKEKVINHHMEVPFRVLETSYTYGDDSGNMIIHGDNLSALKSLLPRYEGKIRCIYIDPPYNTGNEGWVYNDNVNDPRIKKWLGEVVGTEGEDLSRHDKWLCMMYPRLKLLHRLLADDGVIFISIDDNELYNLKMICDEIFGITNFVATIPWRKRTAKSDVPYGISQDFESILCYAKSESFKAAVKGKERKYYETEDFPNRPWRFHDLTKQTTIEERPNSNFSMINPKTGEEYPVNPLRSWAITKETFDYYYSENRIIFPGDYPFLKISKPVLRYWKEDDMKKAGSDFGLVAASTYLPPEIVGMTQDGTKEITDIFGKKEFSFPKPSSLIQYLINIATVTTPDAIILDSFAGSGTTAHAVLNMNKQDGGNRKFILIEMCDYAETITAERVKRVIDGYGDGKKAVDGTGGGFTFYELGETLLNGDLLNENVEADKIREYVYFTETKQELEHHPDEPYFMGKYLDTAYYFYYEKDSVTTLDRKFLHTVKTKAESYVMYADRCFLSDEQLEKFHITFKKIPRDIARL